MFLEWRISFVGSLSSQASHRKVFCFGRMGSFHNHVRFAWAWPVSCKCDRLYADARVKSPSEESFHVMLSGAVKGLRSFSPVMCDHISGGNQTVAPVLIHLVPS
ncbi:hypothetical protein MLD38_028119 [Melastoma candidum]|uniref:Uncharacterized protein n=1 Tax=Melastoma candidum TaxID=119954 RepID=A0ACB9N1M3_9MYRT|nr:hypothetical protein MLD38_028119 [Melastoma candidum]